MLHLRFKMMLLLSILCAAKKLDVAHLNPIYNNCIQIYGEHQFTEVYSGYGDKQHYVSARKLVCSRTSSYWLIKLATYIGLAKNSEERVTLLHRLGYFGVDSIEESTVELTVNGKQRFFDSDDFGDVHALTSEAPNTVSSPDASAPSYLINKPIMVISDNI